MLENVKAVLEQLGAIEGNKVRMATFTLGPQIELGRGNSPDYGTRAANYIEHVGDVGSKPILLGDVIEVTREGTVIARGFPRFVQGNRVLITDGLESLTGDDVRDAPADGNTSIGRINEGVELAVRTGDKVILYANSITRGLAPNYVLGSFLREHRIN